MVRRLRSWSGIVLFTYLVTHYSNHALGLISLDAMEAGREWFVILWRNPLGTVALYGALLTHLCLVLWTLYQRRSLRMPGWQISQIMLGLMIPPLLAEHIVGTRLLAEIYGIGDTYTYVVLVLWEFAPEKGVQQAITLIVAWLHGCMGLHFWLRLKPWYPRLVVYLYGAALLLPVLALLGFANAGQEVSVLAAQPGWAAAVMRDLPFPTASEIAMAGAFRDMAYSIFIGLLITVAVARLARAAAERRHGVFHLVYPDGRRVRVSHGSSILEASRSAAIPHAQVCGGRGRCSTCRVRCGEGFDALDQPSADEQRVLDRVGAPPRVRLACQTKPSSDLEVTPLLPSTATPGDSAARQPHLQGSEQEIAILFADLRGFTKMSEKKLPYDVVFLLNRYFRAMGEAIESAGGQVDKFIGDGVMALFGINQGAERGCREALAGARAMGEALEELNKTLNSDLEEPLRIGIGIHTGPVIVGEMGYADAVSITAIGDAVNTASRLEALTKQLQCQLIVSADVEERSKIDLTGFPNREIEVRGREEPLTIRMISESVKLPSMTAPATGNKGSE